VRSTLDLVRLGTGLQLWNVNGQNDGVWWTLEELGSDATVVRSASNGNTREVWVLRDGADKGASGAIAALTASLAAREKLQRELDAYRSAPEVTISAEASREADVEERERAVEARERELELEAMRKSDRAAWEREVIVRDAAREARAADEAERERRKAAEKEERGREADAARRIRERLDEMEEREREVGRRELWIMDAMRKLSDKARENANELTMEDRITERLKVYQRQLAELHLSTE
jgi:hypothetical protein